MTRLQRFRALLMGVPDGADYMAQIKILACPETKPVIPPLVLPQIRPLVAVPAARVDRVSRFRKRMGQ